MNASETHSSTRAWVIQKPTVGRYTPDCLRLEDRALAPVLEGEMRLRTIFISLDPTYLNWLRLEDSYVVPLAVGDTMQGIVLAVVEESRADGFAPGDVVTAMADWAAHSIVSTRPDQVVRPAVIARGAGMALSAYLTIFSHIGLVAMIGMGELAKPQPGEIVLVSGAAGAAGMLAAQIAKAYGATVIGIAGGPQKCRSLLDAGLDGAIDYKNEDVGEAISRLCPDGIDVYFDNVGGPILDAVLMRIRTRARLMICGEISQYDLADPADRYGPKNLFQLVLRSARMEGFVPPDYEHRYEAMFAELGRLYSSGAITHRPHIVHGLDQVADAMKLLVTGASTGKLMAQVSPDPWAD